MLRIVTRFEKQLIVAKFGSRHTACNLTSRTTTVPPSWLDILDGINVVMRYSAWYISACYLATRLPVVIRSFACHAVALTVSSSKGSYMYRVTRNVPSPVGSEKKLVIRQSRRLVTTAVCFRADPPQAPLKGHRNRFTNPVIILIRTHNPHLSS